MREREGNLKIMDFSKKIFMYFIIKLLFKLFFIFFIFFKKYFLIFFRIFEIFHEKENSEFFQ